MKSTKLYAAATVLLLTACSSPKVITDIVKTYPGIIPADSVYVIELGEKVPNTAEALGRVSVVDRGNSTHCRYDQVLHLAKEATGQVGGNGLVLTDHLKPSFWGSSCHQISGLMLRLSDREVDTLSVSTVQDMIDLDKVITRKRKASRRVSPHTFEASIGYGWVDSKLYDMNGESLGFKGGLDWKLSYEYAWSSGWGVGVQYSGSRTSFEGGDMMLSYIAPELLMRARFNRWILKWGLGVGLFLYDDSYYNASGVGMHVNLGMEYMLSDHWGIGLSFNTINASLPNQEGVKLKDNERSGISRLNALGGLRYYF